METQSRLKNLTRIHIVPIIYYTPYKYLLLTYRAIITCYSKQAFTIEVTHKLYSNTDPFSFTSHKEITFAANRI